MLRLSGMARLGYLLGDDCGWQSFPRLETGRATRSNGSVVPGVCTYFPLSPITDSFPFLLLGPTPSGPRPQLLSSHPPIGLSAYQLSTHSSSTTPLFQMGTTSAATCSSPAQCRETYRFMRHRTTFKASQDTCGRQTLHGSAEYWMRDARASITISPSMGVSRCLPFAG